MNGMGPLTHFFIVLRFFFSNLNEKEWVKKGSNSCTTHQSGMRYHSSLPGSTFHTPTSKHTDQEGTSILTGSYFSDCHLILKRTKWKRVSFTLVFTQPPNPQNQQYRSSSWCQTHAGETNHYFHGTDVITFSQDGIFCFLKMQKTKKKAQMNFLARHSSYLSTFLETIFFFFFLRIHFLITAEKKSSTFNYLIVGS